MNAFVLSKPSVRLSPDDERDVLDRKASSDAARDATRQANQWHEDQAARLRETLLTDFDAYSYDDLMGAFGATVAERLFRAWSQQRLITVAVGNTGRFPGFQLRGPEIVPGIAESVEALAASGLHGWPAALWFTASNGWLADRRPVDVLQLDPASVADAARRRLEPAD